MTSITVATTGAIVYAPPLFPPPTVAYNHRHVKSLPNHTTSRAFTPFPTTKSAPCTRLLATYRPYRPPPCSPLRPTKQTIKRHNAAALGTALTGSFLHLSSRILSFFFGISGGGGGGSGSYGGGGGGGGGDSWSWVLCPGLAVAKDNNDDDDDSHAWDLHGLPVNSLIKLNKLNAFKHYKVSEINAFDTRKGANVGEDDVFLGLVSVRPGGICTKSQLEKELANLVETSLFEKVDLEAKTKADGTIGITVSFVESRWSSADKLTYINVGLMPLIQPDTNVDKDMTQKEIMDMHLRYNRDYERRIKKARPCMLPKWKEKDIIVMLSEAPTLSSRLLMKAINQVEKWYHDNGYVLAKVVNFGKLGEKEVFVEVHEGDITDLQVKFEDKLGNACEGNTHLGVVKRALPNELRPGKAFNIKSAQQALRDLNSLNLFNEINIIPHPDEKKDGGSIVEVKLGEKERTYADVQTEWSFVPDRRGRPMLASFQPGGSVSFEHRNIKGLNRSIHGSLSTTNFFNPQDDLSFRVEYEHPYVDGVYNPANRTLRASCFNGRKVSPVFVSGPGLDEVPSIWVDRVGVKVNVTENITKQSNFTYGLVLEEITTRDENLRITPNGKRVLANGCINENGPPTTLSGAGVDRMAFLQANITRDNTKFINGALVGERNIFQVDQGLGIGSTFPFFNRHQLTLTRFIPLKKVEEGVGKLAPPVLVLHGRYAGCVGDLASYDAFTLGGPYSVRGYGMGEIAAARNILELATELRIPVKNKVVYAFVELGNDLGSSKDVKGNPTEVYRRMGGGASYGAGIKLGSLRLEYAIDHNSGTGAVSVRVGERF